jgi:Protein of unknown function (DUF4054)
MTTGVVVFDPDEFKLKYPVFSTVDDVVLENSFDVATLYLSNTEGSAVRAVERRKPLLYLLTAHITKLVFGDNTGPASGLVGRINSATEGSVSVATGLGTLAQSAEWYSQTTWGFMYWQATSIFRRFRYVPGASEQSPDPSFGYGIRGRFG